MKKSKSIKKLGIRALFLAFLFVFIPTSYAISNSINNALQNFEVIIIEESDTDSIITEESDTNSNITKKSDTNSNITKKSNTNSIITKKSDTDSSIIIEESDTYSYSRLITLCPIQE